MEILDAEHRRHPQPCCKPGEPASGPGRRRRAPLTQVCAPRPVDALMPPAPHLLEHAEASSPLGDPARTDRMPASISLRHSHGRTLLELVQPCADARRAHRVHDGVDCNHLKILAALLAKSMTSCPFLFRSPAVGSRQSQRIMPAMSRWISAAAAANAVIVGTLNPFDAPQHAWRPLAGRRKHSAMQRQPSRARYLKHTFVA